MIPEGYEIFADGRIRRPDGEWQKFSQLPQGYFQFTLTRNGKQQCYAVHRLVCERFHGPKPFPGAQVRHLNGDSQDNRAENLKWGTAKENGQDRHRHGTIVSKLNGEQVREIRKRYASGGETTRSLATKYAVTASTIDQVIRNKTWYDPDYTPPGDTFGRRGGAKGERVGTAKLTWTAVREIRGRYAAGGETTRSLGAEYGVSAMTTSKIIRNIFWVDEGYTPPSR